ncbi:MAG TPA: sensor domain-containing diguanylate cyclase [Acidimicrobiales bacterium]|nr:sensor domain-containing diguanylate cyclase [Acidimicrobiales bacterium]
MATRWDPEVTGEPADLATPVRGRLRLWNAVVCIVFASGMVLSALGALGWHTHVQDQAGAAFARDASAVSTGVSSALARDEDFVAIQRGGILALPTLSNHELAKWFQSLGIEHRYPGGVGFGFVQRVLPSQLAAFGAQVLADPPINEPVSTPYAVFPAGRRSQYCLQRFGIATSPAARVIPPTFDFCSATIPPDNGPSPIPSLLTQAADTGQITVLAAGAIAKTKGLGGLFVVFMPVYDGVTTPPTAGGRRDLLHGWIVATFNGPHLLRSEAAEHAGVSVSLSFKEPGSGVVAVASAGSPPTGPTFTRSQTIEAGGSWIIKVTGSARSNALPQALWVGATGAALSCMLLVLFVLLTRSRSMALRLVDKRTRQLRHQALYDWLTDLPNRQLILDRAEQMLMRAQRHPLLVGALFVDLDNFKDVNDTFGHHVGDQLLRAVAVRLAETLRANDSVGRLGGDEFVVLAEGELGGIGPELVAERILTAFTRPFTVEDERVGPLSIRASIGVAVGARDGAAQLLRDADVALYEAKARGKHGYVVFGAEVPTSAGDGTVHPAGATGAHVRSERPAGPA